MSKKTKTIFNPLTEDFTVHWDKGGNNSKKIVLIAHDFTELEEHLADHAAKHLSNFILNKEGWPGSNPRDKRKEILEEIYTEI